MGSLLLSSARTPRSSRVVRRRAAFTLLELLVVIAIIAILAALIMPGIVNAQKAGRQVTSINNLRQWGVAFASSVSEFSGQMPSDGGVAGTASDPDAWYNRMPPHIKVTPLKNATADLPKLTVKSLWINPGAPNLSTPGVPFCYGFNDYLSTPTEPNMHITKVVYSAKTVLMAEKIPDTAPASNPSNIRGYYTTKSEFDPEATCDVLFVDGHAEPVKYKVYTLPSAVAPADEDAMREAPFLWVPFPGAEL